MNAVHFGAGNIGRGFIGYLLAKSGYSLVFVDIFEELVNNINQIGRYKVITLGAAKNEENVGSVRAVSLKNEAALEQEVLNADLITLSIGANNLKSTGKVLAKALQKRFHDNPRKPLDVIACENALFATEILKKAVFEGADEEFAGYLEKTVGFPNCAVDRIVPATAVRKESPIDVAVEDFYEWDVEKDKVKVNNAITGVNYVKDLAPYLERKIFLLNGAHALIAYTGYRKHYRFVHEAIRDPEILQAVRTFHREAIAALSRKYGMDRNALDQYAEKLVHRFENAYLQDELTRVGRDPVRKLSGNDRLVAPLRLCSQYGMDYDGIVYAIAAGFAFDYPEDPKAAQIQKLIAESGISETVRQITGLDENNILINDIVKQYNAFVGKA